jgi:hypothetical protein
MNNLKKSSLARRGRRRRRGSNVRQGGMHDGKENW